MEPSSRHPETTPPGAGLQSHWKPGQSGNPKGRPKGSKNRATVIAEQLIQGEAQRIVRSVIDRALEGDGTCLRLCLERLVPPLRERQVSVSLPKLETPQDVPGAISAVLEAVTSGDLLPSEGAELAKLVDGYRRALEVEDLHKRVLALERELRSRR